MKIAYVATGAAGMYCGTCLHDNTLAAALKRRGEDVTLIPTYTPIRTDEKDVSISQVFYGGINAYLEQKFSFFRHTPRAIDWLFNRPGLLGLVSKLSASTNAKDLGALTVSVLRGENGHQKKELDRLVEWLALDPPELIVLNNSMFLGMVRALKERFDVPVVCGLQGEDIFLNDLPEPYRSQATSLQRESGALVDAFLAPNSYYADVMASFLGVSTEKISIVPLGISLDGHGVSRSAVPGVFTVGYLARVCPEKGLHILADAFRELAKMTGPEKVRLKVAGYVAKKDAVYLDEVVGKIRDWNLEAQFELVGEVDRDQKIDFLSSLDVLCVPTVYRESKGLYVLEALANAIPVVVPDHGSFPELIEGTGGGVLVGPEDPVATAEALFRLMEDEAFRRSLGEAGQQAVKQRHTDDKMAETTAAIFGELLKAKSTVSRLV